MKRIIPILFFLLIGVANAVTFVPAGVAINTTGAQTTFVENTSFSQVVVENSTISFNDSTKWSNLTINTTQCTDLTEVEIKEYTISYPDNYYFDIISEGTLNMSLDTALNNTQYAIKTDGDFDNFIVSTNEYEVYKEYTFGSSSKELQILPAYINLTSPYDGRLFNESYPPLEHDIDFEWVDVGADKYILTIANDISFNVEKITKTVFTNYTTVSLKEGGYYWKVVPYFNDGGTATLSPIYDFSINIVTGNITALQGSVYAQSNGASTLLKNAEVIVYNGTWQDSFVTGDNGYYIFTDVVPGPYSVYATKEGYTTTPVHIVSITNNTTTTENILMQVVAGEGQYYKKHYVRFIVTDRDLSTTYAANIKIYEGESTTVLYTQDTGSDGAAGFWLDQKTRYRVETTYGGQTQTDYITPSDPEYYIFLDWIATGDTFLPANQFYDDVNITVSKNDDTGVVTVYYSDSLEETNTLKFQIGHVNSTNDFVLIEESTEFADTDLKTFSFAALTNYVGQDYQVRVLIDHDSFGTITKKYGVSFPGSNLPFGRGIAYLCVFVLLIVGMQFSEKDANSGAILICGLASLMWYMDIFEAFGSAINTLMGVGLGMAVFYAVLKYINDKRMTEGL